MVIGWKIHQSRKGRKRGIVLAVNNEVKGVSAAMSGAVHMLCKACRLEQIFEIKLLNITFNFELFLLRSFSCPVNLQS